MLAGKRVLVDPDHGPEKNQDRAMQGIFGKTPGIGEKIRLAFGKKKMCPLTVEGI